MNLHHLRVFAAVAEHGGIGAAAKALNISQPAVSHAIHEFELQVGLPLLERTGRGVRLTAEGAEIYAHARGVYAAERSVEEAIASLKGVEQGSLHLGASTTIASYVLPEIISRFTRAHPGIDVQLSAVHTRRIVELLTHYELDVAVAEAPVSDPRIRVTPWRIDEMVVICAPAHRLVGRGPVDPSVLEREMLILREPESGTRKIVVDGLARVGVTIRRSISVDSTEVIKQLAAEGLGIAVVSRVAVRDQLNGGRLVMLDVDGLRITRPFNRLSMKGRRPSSAARVFLTFLSRAATAELVPASGSPR
jgi:DNA-binding transcriptional LysR family regulator